MSFDRIWPNAKFAMDWYRRNFDGGAYIGWRNAKTMENNAKMDRVPSKFLGSRGALIMVLLIDDLISLRDRAFENRVRVI